MPTIWESQSRSTKWRQVSEKRTSMLGARGSSVVKQGTSFSNTTISSQLRELFEASFSLISPPGVAARVQSSTRQASFSIEQLVTCSCPDLMASERGTCTVGVPKIGSSWETSGQVFLASKTIGGSVLERCLRYFFLKLTLKFGAISSSSSSSSSFDSRIMQGATGSSSRLGLSPIEGKPIES